jgi:type 1 glutamine amidotransferase
MKMRSFQKTVIGIVLALALGPAAAAAQDRILVFSKTVGFRHGSIADGLALLRAQGANQGFLVEATEDSGQFTPTNLARFRAVVWLSTTGDVLNTTQEAAFEQWLSGGGGYVGIHAAADCEYQWAWYGAQALGNGAWFANHPAIQTATVVRESATDASTAHLPATFSFTDEWYNFRANPRPVAEVLLTLDESSYSGGTMGADHPISWKRAVGSGRSWYTGLGHRSQTFTDARFQQHLLGGLLWAMGREKVIFYAGFE